MVGTATMARADRFFPVRAVAAGVILGLTLGAVGCKCNSDESERQDKGGAQLAPEQQLALDIERTQLNLNTAQDYSQEAFLAIDLDNLLSEFEQLEREIAADVPPAASAP